MFDQALASDLLGKRVEVQPRPRWNPPEQELATLKGGYSIDSRQVDNEPVTGIVRSIAATPDGFMFHIEADGGRLIVKTSIASNLRVLR